MRLIASIFILGMFSITLIGCDETGGGGGFTPTGSILAVAEFGGESELIKVGGTPGSVPSGSTVDVTNLNTGETQSTTGLPDGSFDPEFMGSTNDIFNVLVTQSNGIIAEDAVIGVTLLSGAVRQNLAQLGSVPADIEIRNSLAYVINGFSNNIQIFDINQSPPVQTGVIVLPPSSNPIDMAFIDDTRAYVANNIGQSVAIVNVQTLQCETLLVRAGEMGTTTPCINVITVAADAFEEPVGVAIVNNKLYVSNNNLDESFSPNGNGFITVINPLLNLIQGKIQMSGANTSSMITIGNTLYALNNGNILFDFETFLFSCDFDFPPSVDVINTSTDSVTSSIAIPLSETNSNVCLPNNLTADSNGFAYTGLGLVGAILKVDLILETVVNGPDNPIIITDLSGLNSTADIAIKGDLLFASLFNSDQIAVVDTTSDLVNPFPYIAPFPAGIRAENPGSEFFDGVQSLAIRPGTPGVDFPGSDIYFITGISEQLGTVDSTLQTQ